MAEIEMVACCTCGHEWPRGQDGSHSCAQHMQRTIEQQAAEIEQWRKYRAEIADMEHRLGKLARNFLDCQSWEDAAKCALKAEGMRWVRGRMPPEPTSKPALHATPGQRAAQLEAIDEFDAAKRGDR